MTLYSFTKTNKRYYVYLMYDPSKDRYKIGVSADPERRLRTFHTVDPGIVLLAKWGPCSRKQAYDMEALAHLHGEWFRLSQRQVDRLLKPAPDPPELTLSKLASLAIGGVVLAFLILLLQTCSV